MKKILIIFTIATFLLMACTKEWLDVNDNPDEPAVTGAENMFTNVLIERGGEWCAYNDLTYYAQYTQQTHRIPGRSAYANWYGQGHIWQHIWWRIGGNVHAMIRFAKEQSKWHHAGAGEAIKAYVFLECTDTYGDIPYTTSFQGKINPEYDPQSVVYGELLKLCDQALENLSKDCDFPLNYKGFDWMCNGDVEGWKKFVWATKARLYNHLTKKTAGEWKYDPDKVLSCIDKTIQSNEENLTFEYPPTTDVNRMCAHGATATDNVFSELYVDYLKGKHIGGVPDPRLGVLVAPIRNAARDTSIVELETPVTVGGVTHTHDTVITYQEGEYIDGVLYRGLPAGREVNEPQIRLISVHSLPDTPNDTTERNASADDFSWCEDKSFYHQDFTPWTYFSNHEMRFIEAEAAYHKGDMNRAFEAYKKGIEAHMQVVGVPDDKIKEHLENTAIVPATAAELELWQIMAQKFLAIASTMYLETWTDLRRYDYGDPNVNPELPYPIETMYPGFERPANPDPDRFPEGKWLRRQYPHWTEIDFNRSEIEKLGFGRVDYQTIPMWWDIPGE